MRGLAADLVVALAPREVPDHNILNTAVPAQRARLNLPRAPGLGGFVPLAEMKEVRGKA